MKNTMKKVISVLLVTIIIFGSALLAGLVGIDLPSIGDLFAQKAEAATNYKEEYYTYTVSDGKATITDVPTWIIGNITIPSTLGGYPVTSIGSYAFENCTGLTSISIPNSVTSIGGLAFYGCTSLASIAIPNSVTSIGGLAFYGCTSLASIAIPNSVTSIGGSAFAYCTSLKSVTIPNSVTSIGGSAFTYCTSLKSVTIPNSVTSIGSCAFQDCTSLESITIPDSVTSIGSYAFYNTAYYNNESNWKNDVLYIGNHLIQAKRTISGSYAVKDGTKTIADDAFYNCTKLNSITIPDSVTSIGDDAFRNCTNLESVNYTGTREEWCKIKFSDSDSNPVYYSGCLYINGEDVGNVIVPDGVTELDYTFCGCGNLTSITIPDSVTSIGGHAFSGCTSLKSITIPDSVTSIGWDAFYYCTSLESVNYTGTREEWCRIKFSSFHSNPVYYSGCLYINGEDVGNVIVPDGVTELDYTFCGCGNLTSITIPDSVTSIGHSAFRNCTNLESVNYTGTREEWCRIKFSDSDSNPVYYSECLYINGEDVGNVIVPDGVTELDYTFRRCSNLTSITIPDSVTSIGYGAFEDCTSLASVNYTGTREEWCRIKFSSSSSNPVYYSGCLYINGEDVGNVIVPDGVTELDYTFRRCGNLTSITIPDSVTSIGNYAFAGCASLESVTIPDSVTSIGNGVFDNCINLESITIPNSVTSIGDYAFRYCTSLTSVTIPDSVTSIGYCAFEDCTSLKSITIPDSVTSIGHSAFEDCTSLESIVIPNSVTSIGGNAFEYCTNLKSITIPDSVTSIGGSAFKGCTSLESVTIPNGVTSIGENAFYNCTSLESITIPDSVMSIGNCAFGDCTSLKSITIPDGVTEIGFQPFRGCTGLERINMGNGIKSLSIFYFKSYISLKEVTIGNSITSIDGSAFKDCTNLESITIPNSVTSIGAGVFSGCTNLKSITIPDNVTSIGSSAFQSCTSLESVTIPNSVTSIDWCAFEYCTNLKSITIPDSVTSIGSSAFKGCTSLESVTIPNSVTSIDWCAFEYCTSLESITIGKNVTSIGSFAFFGCTSLESITVDLNNKNYSNDEHGVLYNKDKTELIQYPIGNEKTSYNIDSVKRIGDDAFCNCTNLESITIPDSVTSIGGGAFLGCSSLESITVDSNNNYYSNDEYGVLFNKNKTELIQYPIGNSRTSYTIPNSVTSIVGSAFFDCESLESITIPNSVTSIGSSAFSGCISLESITIPDSVTSIGSSAFSGCISLESITIPDSVTSIGSSAFSGCISLESITIPDSVTSIGSYAFCNCTSLENITIPNSVTSIGSSAFSGCISLESITIPDGVTSIGDYAFYNCTSLASMTIPDSVTSIGGAAFGYCTSLKSITIPNTVTSIGDSAFSGCISLESITVDLNNKNYSSDEYGVLFNKDKTELIQYPAGNSRTSYTIPNSVTSIRNSAFGGCTSLASITVDSNNKDYSNDEYGVLFNKGKTKLIQYPAGNSRTSYTIPNSVTSIGDYAFVGCTSLASITVDSNNKDYSNDEYGVLFNKGKTKLIQYPIGNSRTNYTIPNRVISIGDSAFFCCTNLESVTIPDSVKSIGEGAFCNCTSLENITVDKNNNCYSNDEYGVLFNKNKTILIQYPAGNSRTSYALPDGISYIKSLAFYNCTSLTDIIIPNNIIYIDALAFENCTSLSDVYFPGDEETLSNIIIDNIGNEYFTNATFHFNKKAPTDPTEPTPKPTTPPVDPDVVSQPSQTSISYGDSIILHVDASKIPEGGYVKWTADNGNFSYDASADGSTCKITPKSSGTTTFTATIYDKDGNAVSSDTQQMKSKAGVLEKIIAFFKNLFGLTKTYPNAFKYIF